jgi:hypothetical protein
MYLGMFDSRPIEAVEFDNFAAWRSWTPERQRRRSRRDEARSAEQSLRAHQLIKSLSAVAHLAVSNIVKRSPSSALIHVLD